MKSQDKTRAGIIDYKGGKIRITAQRTYAADIHVAGTRKRKRFESEAAAKEFIDEQQAERGRLGELAVKLTPRQVEDAADALHELAAKGLEGTTLTAAARFFSKHHAPESGGWTVQEAHDAYLQELEFPEEGTPARPRTLADKRGRLASFVELYGETPIERITEADVSGWLDSTGAGGRHLRNFKTQIQSLFNYAERNAPDGYRNTVAKFPQRRAKEVDPAPTLTPRQVEAVMREIEEVDARSTVTMALGFFAGIRSDEVASIGGKPGLEWADIDLEEGIVRVPAYQSKTGKVRDVRIPENLAAWLTRYQQEEGTVAWSYGYFRKHREKACTAAGVKWGNNLARHSFATYYAKLHGKHEAAEQLGHRGSVSMIEDHYMGRAVRRDVAEKYFKILPKKSGKVIPLSNAG